MNTSWSRRLCFMYTRCWTTPHVTHRKPAIDKPQSPWIKVKRTNQNPPTCSSLANHRGRTKTIGLPRRNPTVGLDLHSRIFTLCVQGVGPSALRLHSSSLGQPSRHKGTQGANPENRTPIKTHHIPIEAPKPRGDTNRSLTTFHKAYSLTLNRGTCGRQPL